MREWLQRLDLPNLPDDAIRFGWRILAALALLLVGFWLAARIANLLRRALDRGHVDGTLTGFLRNAAYGVMIVLVLVITLDFAGVPSAPLITALGAGGLAIGLALQGSLSNLAWGVLLIVFRPLRVGDTVQFDTLIGTVERIGLMQTCLVLPDNREAIVPNAKVGGDAIINYNRRGTRRFELKVGIGYGDDIGHAMQAVRALFAADPRILDKTEPGVWVDSLGDSSVNLVIRAWTRAEELWETQTAFTRTLKERFDAEGISIPFPQHEVTVRQAAPAA